MAHAVIVNNGVVENIVVFPDAGVAPAVPGLVIPAAGVVPQLGWTYDAGSNTFSPPQPSLAAAQATQTLVLTAACQSAITGGFTSSALGAVYTYPSTPTDQINLLGSVADAQINSATAGWSTPFWCEDASGAWGFRTHTAAQITQVGQDGKAHVVACQTKLAALLLTVKSATTVAAVQAIAWTAP